MARIHWSLTHSTSRAQCGNPPRANRKLRPETSANLGMHYFTLHTPPKGNSLQIKRPFRKVMKQPASKRNQTWVWLDIWGGFLSGLGYDKSKTHIPWVVSTCETCSIMEVDRRILEDCSPLEKVSDLGRLDKYRFYGDPLILTSRAKCCTLQSTHKHTNPGETPSTLLETRNSGRICLGKGRHRLRDALHDLASRPYGSVCFRMAKPKWSFGCGSKNRYQNGTLVSGNMDQNPRNPSCLILSHSHFPLGFPLKPAKKIGALEIGGWLSPNVECLGKLGTQTGGLWQNRKRCSIDCWCHSGEMNIVQPP